jgi:hypothetical protein
MTRHLYWLAAMIPVAACAAAPFDQNIGPSHRVRSGMTPGDVIAIMDAEPVERVSLDGVDEWRYCATRDTADVVVVFFFHEGRVVAKETYWISPEVRRLPPLTPESRHVESCLDNLENLYVDSRKPPKFVRELRARRPGRGAERSD